MRKLLFFTILVILYGSFYPWHFVYIPGRPFLLPVSLSDKHDLILNFWLYAPIGVLAYWVFAGMSRLRWILPVCLGLALSTFVEMLQYFVPTRVSSLDDVLANGLGTVGGMLLAAWAGSAPRLSRWQIRRSPEAFLLACWVAALVFPFFPVHGPYPLMANVRASKASPFLWTDLVVWTIAWVVVWQLIPRVFVRDNYEVVAGVLLLMVPARLFLILRVLTKAEIAAALIALCIAPLLKYMRIPPLLLASAILAALAIRGLTPFEFSSVATQFNWIPMGGFLKSDWQSVMLVLILKLFWYGAAVWTLNRCGLGLSWSSGLLAALLLAIEILQRHMPAHVPEITDPLLAFACGVVIHAFRPSTSESRHAFELRASQPAPSSV